MQHPTPLVNRSYSYRNMDDNDFPSVIMMMILQGQQRLEEDKERQEEDRCEESIRREEENRLHDQFMEIMMLTMGKGSVNPQDYVGRDRSGD